MPKSTELTYNIFSKLRGDLEDFEQQGIYIVGKPSASDQYAKEFKSGREGGYYFSQRETLEAVDLACASKFKRGSKDKDGNRKTYMNIVNFYADVSIMKTGVNVSNYILEPEGPQWTWPVFFMDKKFKEWSAQESYDDIIDELNDDYCRKGTCVVKRVRGSVERVPLRTLRNSQGAKSLNEAAKNGGYVIIENEMHYNKMKKYKAWKIDSLDKDKTYCIFERYALAPRALLLKFKDQVPTEKDWDDMILTTQILCPDEASLKGKAKEEGGTIVFMESLEDLPLEEAHYEKVDGRWLGKGEVEKQFENQIARNLTANLRRRGLLWAVKKIFQSTDDEVQKNLLLPVKDGEVLKIKPNGAITPVNTQSQHQGDFNNDDAAWDKNSQQNSFAFESATGAAMPSGTPFRLGVILEQAVAAHFKTKQDTFSNFLKRSFFDQILPLFRKDVDYSHIIRYSASEDNYDQIREAMVVLHTNERVKKAWADRRWVTFDEARKDVEDEMNRHPFLFIEMPEDFYKEPQCYMKLNINEPIGADIETLTTLYTTLSQKGDPRADRVLRMILSKKGNNLDYILGPSPKVAPGLPAGAEVSALNPAPQNPAVPVA